MWTTPIGRVRLLGMIEGVSFLLLLGIAMPLKYFANKPEAVSIVGWIHGVLFVALCIAIVFAMQALRWTTRQALVPFVAALLPFGPFIIDRRLREQEVDC